MTRMFLLPLIGIVLSLGALTAPAQVPTVGDDDQAKFVLPDPLTQEAIRELVARLSDDQVRALLLSRLDAVAAETVEKEAEGEALLSSVVRIAQDTGNSLVAAVETTPHIADGVVVGVKRFFAPRGWPDVFRLVGITVLAILIGLAVEQIIDRIARVWRERIRTETPEGLRATLGLLLRRAVLDVIGLIAFYIVTKQVMLAMLSTTPPATADGSRSFPDALIGTTFVATVIMFPRVIRTVTRFLMAPRHPALRLVHTDDWTARFLHRQQAIVFSIWGLISFIIPFLASHGVPMGELRLGAWLNLAAYLIILYTTWRARSGLVSMLVGRDSDVTKTERRVAEIYPYLCLGLIFITWLVIEALVSQRLFGLISTANLTMVILLFAPAFDTLVRGLVKHLVPPMSGEGAIAEQAHHSTKRSYIRIGRVVIAWLVIIGITRLWGLDWTNMAAAGVGAQLAGRMIEFVYFLMAGYLVWELTSLWINRKLAAEQTAAGVDPSLDEVGGEGGGTGGTRLSTVLPLLLGVLKVAIFTIFGLIALGNLGLDITPLLAGAGIVGLAIGFGAQKLVTDVVSGVFFLVDDAFRTGEYVEVDGTFGTVEKISIRSMQLRHHKGAVHTIPYGEIPKLTNYSRDWVIMKMRFTVPFETDPNKIKRIFKQIGKDMMEVPEFAADLLQPFKSQGVFDFDDVGMIIRGKFMAKPGRQFVLRKEIYNRVKRAFEENGIPFARREVRVAIPGLEDSSQLTEADKEAIAAAAGEAAQEATQEAAPKA